MVRIKVRPYPANIPLVEFDSVSPSLVSPQEILAYYQKAQQLEGIRVGEICLGCFDRSVLEELIKATGAQPNSSWIYNHHPERRLYSFLCKGKTVSLICLGFGAPTAVTMMEFLIACGVKRFIFFGSAGAIQPLPLGSLVIASRAIREEGVSYHYLEPGYAVEGSGRVLSALERTCKALKVAYEIGSTWTIDAIFRETKDKVRKYKAEGILTVEMEAAALYAVAVFRKVEAGCLFYISDSLAELVWQPGFLMEEVRQGLQRGCTSILSTLEDFP